MLQEVNCINFLVSRVNLDSAKEYLKRFALMDSDKDGQISLQDFALHYKLPTSTPVKKIFSILDRVRFCDNITAPFAQR